MFLKPVNWINTEDVRVCVCVGEVKFDLWPKWFNCQNAKEMRMMTMGKSDQIAAACMFIKQFSDSMN